MSRRFFAPAAGLGRARPGPGGALLPVLTGPGTAGSDERRPTVEAVVHKSYTETILGSNVRFETIAVPGGTFLRGSAAGEKGRAADEGPRHPVQLRPFWVGRCEVTWDEFDVYLRRTDRRPALRLFDNPADQAADAVTRPSQTYHEETFGYGREGYLVLGITHHLAMEYCRWLSAKTGRAYRLPTEAEWEYACRAGSRTAYFFGDDPGKLNDHAWFDRNADDVTHPVGRKKSNPCGLHDVHGNVAEWCLDHYQKDYYGTFPTARATLSPVKLPGADRFPHVVRGGSWADGSAACRSATRRGSDKSWQRRDPSRPQSLWWLCDADFVGFCVARAVEEQDNLKGIRSKVTEKSK